MYKNKYYKIKKKYLAFKKMLNLNQQEGGDKIFDNQGKFVITLDLNEDSYMHKKINYMNLCPERKMHMTFLYIDVNNNHPYNGIFSDIKKNKDFRQEVIDLIIQTCKGKTFTAKSLELYGTGNPWISLEFTDDDNVTKEWRPPFYNILNKYIKKLYVKQDYKYEMNKIGDYYYYYHNKKPEYYKDENDNLIPGKALYAVRDFYHGVGTFNPHIAICTTDYSRLSFDAIKKLYKPHLENYVYGKQLVCGKDLTFVHVLYRES